MTQADPMTRAQHPDLSMDNTEETLLPNNLFINSILLPDTLFIENEEHETFTSSIDDNLQTEIRNTLPNDAIMKQVMEALKDSKKTFPFKCHPNAWTKQEGLLFFEDRCYIPDTFAIKWKIVEQYYDTPFRGHPR